MKDIPIFTASGGVATLLLREVPHKKEAYILPRSSTPQKKISFFGECWQFCRAAGAERVLLCAQEPEPELPLAYALWQMHRPSGLPLEKSSDVILEPVTGKTVKAYIELYNRLFAPISGAATYTMQSADQLLHGRTYFVRQSGIVGIGQISSRELHCIGVLPQCKGMGGQVLTALLREMEADTYLQVASDNLPAIGLYEKFGFQKKMVLSYWYDLDRYFIKR